MSADEAIEQLERVEQLLGSELVEALVVCAVPVWWSEPLALDLLEAAGHNGSSRAALRHVTALPFVERYEAARTWRVADGLREALLERERSGELVERIRQLLVERYETACFEADSPGSLRARESRWHAVYHAAFVDPAEALRQLVELVDVAAACNRDADLGGAVDLVSETPLRQYEPQGAYVRGRYAYALHDHEAARREFAIVWAAGQEDSMTAIAGHLLGRLTAMERSRRAQGQAETTLRAAIALSRTVGNTTNLGMALCTLADLLLRTKDTAKARDAAELAAESVGLWGAQDTRQLAIALMVLGRARTAAGQLTEAHEPLERAIELTGSAGLDHEEAIAWGTASWLASREHRTADAFAAMERSLRLAIVGNRGRNVMQTAEQVAALAARLPEVERADLAIVAADAGSLVYVRPGRAIVAVSQSAEWDREVRARPLPASGRWRDVASGHVVTLPADATVDALTLLGRWAFLEPA